ncbi:MAG: hypothetical protein ACXVCP_11820 [Bdellovibrio sp.]
MKNSTNTSGLCTRQLQTNSGQAVIEYTLLLIIAVALVLALTTVIFKPFGEFVSNYMGKYVGCLLEYGELPTLGSDTPSGPDDDSECNKKFKPGTLADGRPPQNGGNSGEGNSSSNKSKSGSDKKSDSNSNGGGSGTHAGSASRNGGSNILGNKRPSSGVDGASSKNNGKVVEISLADGGSGSFFKGKNDSGNYTGPNGKTSYIPITGLTEMEKKLLPKKKENGGRTVIESGGPEAAAKKTTVKKPEPKMVAEKEDEPFTIGNFMRYLLIAAIIIVLLIFIGGQALQMSKSFEK